MAIARRFERGVRMELRQASNVQPRGTTTIPSRKPMGNLSPVILASVLMLAPVAAFAQDQGTADERQACEPDVNRLCSQFIPDRDKIIVCLNQKVRQLNPACRNVILFYAQQQICAGDSSRLCGEFAQDREGVLACLSRKTEMLSASCRHALSVYERERR
jgi:hypothetical protein